MRIARFILSVRFFLPTHRSPERERERELWSIICFFLGTFSVRTRLREGKKTWLTQARPERKERTNMKKKRKRKNTNTADRRKTWLVCPRLCNYLLGRLDCLLLPIPSK